MSARSRREGRREEKGSINSRRRGDTDSRRVGRDADARRDGSTPMDLIVAQHPRRLAARHVDVSRSKTAQLHRRRGRGRRSGVVADSGWRARGTKEDSNGDVGGVSAGMLINTATGDCGDWAPPAEQGPVRALHYARDKIFASFEAH